MQTAVQTRQPRFSRSPTRNFILTDADVEILYHVWRHRFVRSTHISHLVARSHQATYRRLNLLFHHGYLDRPPSQLDQHRRAGSQPMVYALADAGVDLLAERFGIPRTKLDWSRKNREAARFTLLHALEVADFMVALEVSCRTTGNLRLLHADELLRAAPTSTQTDKYPERWHVKIQHVGQHQDVGVVPDKMFGLEFTDAPAGRNRAFFFLEADRGTMPVRRRSLRQTSVYRKLLAYHATWRQKLHTERYGFQNFRVLTITASTERLKNIYEANRSATAELGSRIFLFAERSAIAGTDPLEFQWRNGRDELTRLTD